ncbi:MAG TPA: hypothetical protein VHD83_15860 [Puia sp.]|nr:hypothetical protein [Puia sp.]
MTPDVEQKVKELIEKAKRDGIKNVNPSTAVRNGSSLHMIIKTKQQAEAFMRSLRAAQNS